MRFEPPSTKFRGALAQAVAAAYERRQPGRDVTDTMKCPWCKATLSFTVMPNGLSRGHCSGACGIKWTQ